MERHSDAGRKQFHLISAHSADEMQGDRPVRGLAAKAPERPVPLLGVGDQLRLNRFIGHQRQKEALLSCDRGLPGSIIAF